MKTFGKAIIVIAIIVAGAFIVESNPGLFNNASFTGTATQTPNANYQNSNPTTQQATQTYQGDLTIKNTLTDALADSTTYTDGTADNVIFFAKNADGSYRYLATSASNAATITVGPDLTQVWMFVKIPTGENYYVATDAMQGLNPRMGTPTWTTADGGNLLEPTFPIDVTNVGSLNRDNQTPSFTLPIELYAQGTPTINSGSYITGTNHTSVGTGVVQNIEKFTLDFGAQAKAVALTEEKFVLNDTTTTDWNRAQSYCTIPGQPNISWSSFTQNIGASTTTYIYDFGTGQYQGSIAGAILLKVPKVGDTSVPMTCYVYSSLPASLDGFTVTPTFTYLDMQGGTHAVVGHVIKIVA